METELPLAICSQMPLQRTDRLPPLGHSPPHGCSHLPLPQHPHDQLFTPPPSKPTQVPSSEKTARTSSPLFWVHSDMVKVKKKINVFKTARLMLL